MENKDLIIENLDRIHTTELGIIRIRRNVGIDNLDVINFCKNIITDSESEIEKQGKNFYVFFKEYIITINSYSYTIITIHRDKELK